MEKTFCEECGREMELSLGNKRGTSFFNKKTGVEMRLFRGEYYLDSDVTGTLRCPSFWCRLLKYNLIVTHFEYLVLKSGEIKRNIANMV